MSLTTHQIAMIALIVASLALCTAIIALGALTWAMRKKDGDDDAYASVQYF